MPVYKYSALDSKGKKISGIIDAESFTIARQKLRQKGQFPVEIKETKAISKTPDKKGVTIPQVGKGIKKKEINMATRQLATLLGAGIPLVNALQGIAEQTENQNLKTILAQIKESVNEGNSFTDSLKEHPKLFSKIYVNMVQAGESSGSLDIVLEKLAEVGENQEELKGKITAALIYPILMAIVGTAILFALITFVVPKIVNIFADSEQKLPFLTIALVKMSEVFSSYWWLLAIVAILLLGVARYFLNQPSGQRFKDKLMLTTPLIKDLNLKVALSRFARTLASLLHAGVPLFTSLHIVKNILNNEILANVIEDAAIELEKGGSLSQSLKESKWFTPMIIQMIGVGEQSGELEKMLNKAAESYEKEVESKIVAITSLIEPLMIIVMGGLVAVIIMAILLPIFDMNQLIR